MPDVSTVDPVAAVGTASYEWSHEWTDSDGSTLAMAHTGIAITGSELVITGATSEASLVVTDTGGGHLDRRPVAGLTELHDLTLVEEDGEELLWIADTGVKLYGGGRELELRQGTPGRVLQIDLNGRERRRLERPDIPVYESVDYSPTAVAVNETRAGGNGDIWVADGYGAALVHRYTADGRYLGSLSGEEGAGGFDEPHDVLIDRRRATPELYVSDRRNQRIQVYSLDGEFKRTAGESFLPGPTQMAVNGDSLVVTDLLAGRVTLLDIDDRLVAHLFANPAPPLSWDEAPDGWPNARSPEGVLVRADLRQGSFHCPHGVAASPDGTIYISEFAIGGRITILTSPDAGPLGGSGTPHN
jgi:hypothetical protein